MHQFFACSFEVRKHSDDFENVVVQILRFIDDDYQLTPSSRLAEQIAIQLCVHLGEISTTVLDAYVGQQRPEELLWFTQRLKQKCGSRGILQHIEQAKQQGCLSHSGLSDQRGESPP